MSVAPSATSAWTVDASIALKWLLPDEQEKAASDLLEAFRQDRVSLFAPSFIRYEVANGLEQACRRRRIDEAAIYEGMESFLALELHSESDGDELVQRALIISRQTGATVYDATYVAHAELLGVALLSNDKDLLNRTKDFPVVVMRLADISL